ncbi:MAG: hypothetical protein HY304_06420 [candidate division Zixibacteria bacterium]|nr:hypothetical protein [candidate division Zixibacteria bacterium]
MRGMIGFAPTAPYIPAVTDWQIPNGSPRALAQAESLTAFTGLESPRRTAGSFFPLVRFGELLPDGILEEAEAEVRNASAVVSVGTWGTVFPAARLAQAA